MWKIVFWVSKIFADVDFAVFEIYNLSYNISIERKNLMIFDEKNIVLSFAAVSDVHITGDNTDDSEPKFRRAITQIREMAKTHGHDIDAFLVVGDLIDKSWKEPEMQMQAFKSIYSSLSDAPLFYCLGGSHDLYWGSEAEPMFIANFRKHFGEENFVFDVDKESIAKGNRHAVIGSHHFIALEPNNRNPITYPEETKKWLANILESAKNNGKYVFVITHPMITDTCYGSLHGPDWATEDLTPILSKYPNVVIFGGHLHYPLPDERSIMQREFTSVGCGAVRYMAIEQAGYENMSGKTTMRDSWRVSTGHLCEVDKNGAVRFNRIDFVHDSLIKEPWVIPAPKVDGSHLSVYTRARADKAGTPYFSEDFASKTAFEETEGGKKFALTFSAAHDEDLVHHYVVTLKRENGEGKEYRILADFYRHEIPANMAKEITLSPADVFASGEKIFLSITAQNSWGKTSAPAEVSFVVE